MTDPLSGPTTDAELEAALTQLLHDADANDIDVTGAYAISHPRDELATWDVEILEVIP